jgi:TetR/AcrR family fatty acid metabolism transcriptional regulator
MAERDEGQLIAARQHRILDAAGAVFAERGFHQTTIRDVARRAGVADGTIYNYFTSKSDLLFALFDRMRERVVERHAPPSPDEPTDLRASLRAALQPALLGPREDNFALFRVIIAEVLINDELRERYRDQILIPTLTDAERFLRAGRERWGFGPIDPQLAARAIVGLILGLIVEHTLDDQFLAERWALLPDQLADLLANGLSART